MKKPKNPSLSRRDFLKMMGVASSAAVLAGCGQPATPAPTEAPVAPPTQAPTKAPAAVPTEAPPPATEVPTCQADWNPTYPPFEKYDPPVEISTPFSANYDFMLPGDEITNNPMYNRVADNLGIRYQIAWQADGGEVWTRLNNDLAGGTLPDVFRCRNVLLSQFIDSGAIEDITDIFEANASDLTKQKKGYPDSPMWRDIQRDGRIFGVAYIEDGIASDSLAFIRQDWLDQLGLTEPKTLDEFTDVARAFKSAGLCDFPIGACQNLVTWAYSLDPVFGAFGVIPAGTEPGYWIKGDDGKLRYGSLEQGAKQALAVLNTWFTEELIDPDFINKDESGPNDFNLAGQLGMYFHPWWLGHGVLIDVVTAFPEAKTSIIGLPTGPSGLKGRAGTGLVGAGYLFRKGVDPLKIEAGIKQLNWQLEMHVNWEKYQQYGEIFQGAGFFKGYEWDLDEQCNVVAGKLPFTEWMYQRDLVFGYRGMCYPEWWNDLFQSMAKWQNEDPAKLNKAQKFIMENPSLVWDMAFSNHAYSTLNEVIPNAFQGPKTEAIASVLTDLLDLERTAFLEMITGARSLDTFEDFTQEWMDRGGTVFTEEVNNWAAGQ